MIFAIAVTALLGILIYRRTRTQITLAVFLVAVVSWVVVGLGLVTDGLSGRLSFDLPNLRVLIFALAITAILLFVSRLLGEKSYQTVFVLALAVWLAAGMGWLAGEWLGILAITMPSLIILFVGMLALPPFLLPVANPAWKVPPRLAELYARGKATLVFLFTLVFKPWKASQAREEMRNLEPEIPKYIAQWKISALLAMLYTFSWLMVLWAEWIEMDVIVFWIYLQGLLLILRKPLPLQAVRGHVPFVILSLYGIGAVWIWRVFRGFSLNPFNLLILTQGLLALSAYTLPVTGKNRDWAWGLALLYGVGYMGVMSVGRVDVTLTTLAILLLGLVAFLRFTFSSLDESGRLDQRTMGQIAMLIFLVYALIWAAGLSTQELDVNGFNFVTFLIGLVAIFTPVFVEPSQNWQAFKALMTCSLGTNYPYKAIRNRLLVDRVEGDPFAEAFAGPGIVLSDADHVVVIYASGKFRQVRPPGVTFTDTFEMVKEIVDLRVQLRVTPRVKAKTKDGIDVQVTTPTALLVSRDGEQLELGKPYPYDPEAVRKVIHAQRIAQEKDEKQSWDKLVRQACVQVMQDIVAGYTLDELLGSQVRKEIAGRMKQGVQAYIQQNDLGVELVGGGISNIDPPGAVVEQRIEHWKAHWESQVKYLEAQAEAEERRLVENARAQAQRSLFLQITERLEEWERLGLEYDDRARIMALGLLEAIEQAQTEDPDLQLESTRQAQRMLGGQGLLGLGQEGE